MKRSNLIRRMMIIIFVMTMIITSAMPVFADTIIDYVLYTDIRTYINDIEITSYNIKGYTAVVVEDLANYGFDVAWDGAARTLKVARNTGKAVTGAAVSTTSGGKVGDKAMPVYATDIKTYLDGQEVESYNVGGRTIVYVDKLAELYAEDYKWDSAAKTLSAKLTGGAKKEEVKKKITADDVYAFIKKKGEHTTDDSWYFSEKADLYTFTTRISDTDSDEYSYINVEIWYKIAQKSKIVELAEFEVDYYDENDNCIRIFRFYPEYLSKQTGELLPYAIEDGKLDVNYYQKTTEPRIWYNCNINTANLSFDEESGLYILKSADDVMESLTTSKGNELVSDAKKEIKTEFEKACGIIEGVLKDSGADFTVTDIFSAFNNKELPELPEIEPESIFDFMKNNGKETDGLIHVTNWGGLFTYPEDSTEEEKKAYRDSVLAPEDTYQMYVNMTFKEDDTLSLTLNYVDKDGHTLSGFIIDLMYMSTNTETGESSLYTSKNGIISCTWYQKGWEEYTVVDINTKNLSADGNGKFTLKSTKDITMNYSTADTYDANGIKGYFELTCEQLNKAFKDYGSDLTILDVIKSFG